MRTPASETTAGRKSAFKAGLALPPASPGGRPGFPVRDANHWQKARDAVGRSGGGARRHALAKLLKRTAPRFGQSIKGTWIEKELGGASMSNVYNFVGPEGYVHGWIKVGGGSTAGAEHHGKDVVGLTSSGNKVRGRYDAVRHQVTVKGTGNTAQVTHIQPAGQEHSNGRTGMEYDLAARYRALNFTDETPDYGSDSAAQHTVSHDHDGLGEHTHNFASQHGKDSAMPRSGGSSASGASLESSPGALRTPAPAGTQSSAGFSPGSSGLGVRSRGGSYGTSSMSNHTHGIELARRQVTSASDIVVSRSPSGAAVIRHRRGGETIGTIQRLADGTWGGRIEGAGKDLEPRNHQRAALQDLIGGWNRASVTPFRPAMPLQQAPEQTELMRQYGVPAVRALATPATGASSGPRVTGYANGDSDGDGDSGSDSGPAGLSPRGVTIYKKLIKRGFPPARALAFARNSNKFQKAS